jgi:hypothetical protein
LEEGYEEQKDGCMGTEREMRFKTTRQKGGRRDGPFEVGERDAKGDVMQSERDRRSLGRRVLFGTSSISDCKELD